MQFELKLLLSSEISPASVDSLQLQITEVIATALEEKQIEIPDAEIHDYAIAIGDEFGDF